MPGRASISLPFWHCSQIAKLQEWRIKEMQRIHDGIVCGTMYSRASCGHVLNFQRKKKKIKQSLLHSNLIQCPWSKVSHWQGRKLGWTLRHIRCDCIHKISGMRENQFNGKSNVLSVSEYVSFLILLVLIKINPTGKCPFIAKSWLNIMNFCSDGGTYHCGSCFLVFEITVNNHSGISYWM